MLVLSYFVLFFPCIGAGARGLVVDTAGHGGGSILQGLGCSSSVELSLGTYLLLRLVLLKFVCLAVGHQRD